MTAHQPEPVAAIIPIHKQTLSDEDYRSLRHNLTKLAGKPTILIHPPTNRQLIRELLSVERHNEYSIHMSSLELLASDFTSITAYNRLMLSTRFYRAFEKYRHILIVQLDALLLSNKLDAWCRRDWSYVGAPFFIGIDQPRQPLQLLGGGNGGFSLRKVSDCLMVLRRWHWLYPALRRYERRSLPGEQLRAEGRALLRAHWWLSGKGSNTSIFEDLFWSFLAPQLVPSFQVAPANVAMHFAWETAPEHLSNLCGGELPLGCHAWQRHDPTFWNRVLTTLYQ